MLPTGWSTKESKSRGIPYYINDYTKETVWEKPTEPATRPMIDQVQASHILRKHSGSRRASSWRCEKITQSKAEAVDQIREIRQELLLCLQNEGMEAMHKKFAAIARTDSDCSSAQKGGDLGVFGRGTMQKSFEDASYALPVGGLSDVVDSDSGIHIILRVI